jgi:predicted dehydrogenase
MVVYEDGSSEPVRVFDRGVVYKDPATFGEYHLSYRTGDILSPKLSNHEPLSVQIGDFIDTVRRGGPAGHRLQIALEVVRLVEAADLSMANGGDRVELGGMSFANLSE